MTYKGMTVPLGKVLTVTGTILSMFIAMAAGPWTTHVESNLQDRRNDDSRQDQWIKGHEEFTTATIKRLEERDATGTIAITNRLDAKIADDERWRIELRTDIREMNSKLDTLILTLTQRKSEMQSWWDNECLMTPSQ